MRGLWTLEGGFMGGPFISYAFIDPETSRAVMVTGFVYAPREEKRELLRQVEALMYTVQKRFLKKVHVFRHELRQYCLFRRLTGDFYSCPVSPPAYSAGPFLRG